MIEYEVPELKGLAKSLLHDKEAVLAALFLPWSTGPVEGQINRLKLMKRHMYDRANFDLLRLRVLASVPLPDLNLEPNVENQSAHILMIPTLALPTLSAQVSSA